MMRLKQEISILEDEKAHARERESFKQAAPQGAVEVEGALVCMTQVELRMYASGLGPTVKYNSARQFLQDTAGEVRFLAAAPRESGHDSSNFQSLPISEVHNRHSLPSALEFQRTSVFERLQRCLHSVLSASQCSSPLLLSLSSWRSAT